MKIDYNHAMNEIALGRIVSVVGLKGDVKCHLYSSEPTWLDSDVYILHETLGKLKLETKRYPYNGKHNLCVTHAEGVDTIEAAKGLVGCEMWVTRQDLGALDSDEFYFCDVIGKPVYDGDTIVDKVKHVHDFGAGIVFELTSGSYLHVKQVSEVGVDGLKL